MGDVTCRGSFALGTACGKCSRCRREIESYNAMKAVRDKLNTPSSAISRIEELEAKLAKAVEVLERIEDASRYFGNDPEASETTVRYAHETTRRLCSNTLAELKRQNDE